VINRLVRTSCHTTAWPIGRPVRRSHSRLVSRWLAMPMATICSGAAPSCLSAAGTTRVTLRQISSASCSTQPGCGEWWRCSSWATDTIRPAWSNRMQRVEFVPWSTAAM
jgi:hypothetical protein